MINKTSSILLASAILTACGGGGGGGGGSDPAPVPQPDPIDVSSQTLAVPENTSGSITISSKFDDLAFQITDQSDPGAATFTLGEGVLTVAANEVDRPNTISGTLYSEAEGIEASSAKDISIAISNTSAAATLTQANQLIDQQSDILGLAEDKAVLQFVLESAYMSSLVTYSEKTSLINDFDAQSAPTYATTATEIDNLSTNVQSYQQGDIADTQLVSTLSDADAAVASHAEYAVQELTDIGAYIDPFFGDLTQTDMAYDEISGRYSRYLGQPSMGAYSDGSWAFSSEFSLLSALITQKPSDPIQLCEAN